METQANKALEWDKALWSPAPPPQQPMGQGRWRALWRLSGQGCPQVWFSRPKG